MCHRVEMVSNAFCRQNVDRVLHTMSFNQSSCRKESESNEVFIELCWCFSFWQKLILQICFFFSSFMTPIFVTDLTVFEFLRPYDCSPAMWLNWKPTSLKYRRSEVFTGAFKVLHEGELEASPQGEDLPLAWKALHFSAHLFALVIQV